MKARSRPTAASCPATIVHCCCARCHTGRVDTVGPDFSKKPYDVDTVKFFVRHGFAGMPAFTKSMIDNATLDELAAYVAHSKGAPQ